jgi:hypothetical protein
LLRGRQIEELSADCEFTGNLPTQMTLNWKPRFRSFFSIWEVMLSKPTWLWGKMELLVVAILTDMPVQGGSCASRRIIEWVRLRRRESLFQENRLAMA